MTLHLDDLEARVLDAGPGDVVDLSHMVLTDDFADTAPRPEASTEAQDEALPVEIITVEAWAEQWGQLHDLMGGVVSMRTGAPCPLGAQARNEGGQVAMQAAYGLLSANPATARLFLSPNSTYFGQLAALGLHAFGCVQIVKASRQQGLAGEITGTAQAA